MLMEKTEVEEVRLTYLKLEDDLRYALSMHAKCLSMFETDNLNDFQTKRSAFKFRDQLKKESDGFK